MKIIKISAMWCPSCILMNNIFTKLKKEYPSVEFLEYDYDMDEEIVQKYNPGKVLPVIIFVTDKEVERIKGEHSYQEISEIMKRYQNEENN